MRIVVAHPRLADASAAVDVPVGIVRRPAPHEAISLVVKVTFTYAAQAGGGVVRARVASAQEPLSLSVASPLLYASTRELLYPSDFVLEKPRSDVLLVGHAYAEAPTRRIRAGLTAAGVTRRFAVITSDPVTKIPLSQVYLRAEDDDEQRIDAVGPLAPETAMPVAAWDDHDDDDDDDDDSAPSVERAQSATPLQRGELIRSNEIIELIGLSAREPRLLIELPGVSPRVLEGHAAGDRSIDLRGDTLWIDTDRELIVVSWRGQLQEPGRAASGLEELLVSLERDDAPRDEAALRSAVPRGSFAFAVEEEDLREGRAPPAISPEEISMARYSTWGSEAPAPTIPLAAYAAISAELAEGREPRAAVLERHELNEDTWMLEERAWLEAMGDAAMEGDGTVAAAYGELFVAAQDRLADPAEEALSLDDYVETRIAVEAADDPAAALKEKGMTLSVWMRLDRRWTARAEADPRLAEEIERRLERARPEAEEPAPASEEGA